MIDVLNMFSSNHKWCFSNILSRTYVTLTVEMKFYYSFLKNSEMGDIWYNISLCAVWRKLFAKLKLKRMAAVLENIMTVNIL